MHPEILTGIRHSLTQLVKEFDLKLEHKKNPQGQKLLINLFVFLCENYGQNQ